MCLEQAYLERAVLGRQMVGYNCSRQRIATYSGMTKMRQSKPSKTEQTPHERYNRAHPLLRELVLVHVDANDESFDALLTRVPGIGEEIGREDCSYKVLRVQHEPIDDEGRAHFGWHAVVDVELQPDDIGRGTREQRTSRRHKKSGPTPVR